MIVPRQSLFTMVNVINYQKRNKTTQISKSQMYITVVQIPFRPSSVQCIMRSEADCTDRVSGICVSGAQIKVSKKFLVFTHHRYSVLGCLVYYLCFLLKAVGQISYSFKKFCSTVVGFLGPLGARYSSDVIVRPEPNNSVDIRVGLHLIILLSINRLFGL